MNIHEARSTARTLRDQLAEPGARCGKRQAIHLLGLIERLADALDAARRRDDYTDLYANLVAEWNALVGGLRELGIEVSQPAPGPAWHWQAARQTGEAPTMAAAHLAGLRALMEETSREQ